MQLFIKNKYIVVRHCHYILAYLRVNVLVLCYIPSLLIMFHAHIYKVNFSFPTPRQTHVHVRADLNTPVSHDFTDMS